MKQRPILFSTPMVQAILEGWKTQTRRVIKLRDGANPDDESISFNIDGSFDKVMDFSKAYPYWEELKCPYGQPGDVLWVRETWTPLVTGGPKGFNLYGYKTEDIQDVKWKPSIHMPKEACRIFLRITSVRVERLQDISEEDAKAEGVERDRDGWKSYNVIESGPHKGKPHPWNAVPFKDAYHSFESLWQSINGQQSWNDNPWVWVIEFERVEKPTT